MRWARILGLVLLAAPLALLAYAIQAGLAPALGFLGDPLRGFWFYAASWERPSGELVLEGLSGPVVVVYDSWGVPHIYAGSERDLFAAFGFVQACDRLWQMDVLRRVTEGRLAELVGEAGVDSDVLMHRLGMPGVVEESYRLIERLAEEGDGAAAATLEALEAYARGVNACIDYLRGRGLLPLEYRLLGVEPEPWRPVDSVAVAKLIDYVLAFKTVDLYWGLLAGANGGWVLGLYADYLRWLDETGRSIIADPGEAAASLERLGLPRGWATGVELAEPGEARVEGVLSLEALYRALTSRPEGLELEAAEPLDAVYRAAPWLRGLGFSNNWAVSPALSAHGSALLANDPHLELTAPPVWYLVHLSVRGGGLDVYGAAFPGVPFVIIGRTRGLVFGYTNSFVDTTDFYFYVWRGGRYLYRGEWLEPRRVEFEVRVNVPGRGFRVERFEALYTVHGPLLAWRVGNHTVVAAVRSTVLVPEPIAVWAYLMNKAETVREAALAQRYFYSPIQNLVAVDSGGHVLYSPAGLVPVRSPVPRVEAETPRGRLELVNLGFLPFNGSRGEGEWIGFLPFNAVPRLLDPGRGWVATANNLISLEYTPLGGGPYLQWSFLDGYRWLRIASLLDTLSRGGLTLDEMARIQLDVASAAALEVLPLVEAAAAEAGLGGGALALLQQLRGWDGQMLKTAVEPSIAYSVLRRLLWAAWRDATARAGLDPLDPEVAGYVARLEVVEYALRRALGGDEWYLRRMSGASASEVAAAALEAALRDLEGFFGSGAVERWVWGRAHRLLVKHPMGEVLPWLNLGPYPVDGGPYTVNVAPMPRLGEPVTVGASLRLVAAADAEPGRAAYMALPGGESGSVFSRHYRDLLGDWLRGLYLTASMEAPERVAGEATLTLTPG